MSERRTVDVRNDLAVTVDEDGAVTWSSSTGMTATEVSNALHDALHAEVARHARRVEALQAAITALYKQDGEA